MTKRSNKETFVSKAVEVHGSLYDYSEFVYVTTHTKGHIKCGEHGVFEQKPASHLSGRGCPKCATVKSTNAKRLNKDSFVAKARLVHDCYTYDDFVYIDSYTKGLITCPIHGNFPQTPNNHLHGNGCPGCGLIVRGNAKRSTREYFLERAKAVHGDTYDYSAFHYTDMKTKGTMRCRIHGCFEQTPDAHLGGTGCAACGRQRIAEARSSNLEQFIAKAKEVHDGRYEYDQFDYIDCWTNGEIKCKKHQSMFKQTPSQHLRGIGCPVCSKCFSKPETKWLDSLGVPLRQHRLRLINGKYKKTDGYEPATNTVYEYHGNYWHGNPTIYSPTEMNKTTKTSMGDLYQRTLENERLIRESGYNLITIWGK